MRWDFLRQAITTPLFLDTTSDRFATSKWNCRKIYKLFLHGRLLLVFLVSKRLTRESLNLIVWLSCFFSLKPLPLCMITLVCPSVLSWNYPLSMFQDAQLFVCFFCAYKDSCIFLISQVPVRHLILLTMQKHRRTLPISFFCLCSQSISPAHSNELKQKACALLKHNCPKYLGRNTQWVKYMSTFLKILGPSLIC